MKSQKKLKQLANALAILEDAEVQKELKQVYSNQYIEESVEALDLFIKQLTPPTSNE
jgi:hypothetical protein